MDELISRLKRRDETALKEVMQMFKQKIFGYLCLLVRDRQVAEELTQDTFVRVYFKAKTLKGNNLKPWIYKIATNLARSEIRRKKWKNILALSEIQEHHVAHDPTYEKGVMLEQILAQIPDKFRIPLLMKEMDNFSYEEIAGILKKPVGTIKSLVFRSREYMQNPAAQQEEKSNGQF